MFGSELLDAKCEILRKLDRKESKVYDVRQGDVERQMALAFAS